MTCAWKTAKEDFPDPGAWYRVPGYPGTQTVGGLPGYQCRRLSRNAAISMAVLIPDLKVSRELSAELKLTLQLWVLRVYVYGCPGTRVPG
eukprot:619842-Rhodomonas_salina.2